MITVRFQFLATLFTLGISLLYAKEDPSLYLRNIRPVVTEIFNQHIEYKNFSPALARRSMQLYVNRFDPEQMYLLEGEALPRIVKREKDWVEVVREFESNSFSEFAKAQTAIYQSIHRAQKMRDEIALHIKENSLSTLEKELNGFTFSVSYPKNEVELQEKIQYQMQRWFVSYCAKKGMENPSVHDKEKALAFFNRVKSRRENYYNVYPERAKDQKHFSELILKALVSSLDAHSSYYTSEEAYDIRANLKKQFYGVGITLKEDVEGVYITEVLPHSPAEYSGHLHPGDRVIELDGKKVDALSFQKVLELMQGDEGSLLSLKVMSKEGKVRSVHLTREKIVMDDERIQYEAIPFAKGNIGYLKIDAFYDNREGITMEKDLRDAIFQLQGMGHLYGLVIDLRENLGGFLDQAIKMTGLFINTGVVVIAKYANDEIYYSRDYDPYTIFHGPIVILTSKTSASAAEIVSAALQDYGAAVVVGDERTYGKGSMQMQTITDENADHFYKVTVGRYYTISGKSTQINGVKAEIHVPTQFSPYNIGEKFLAYPLSPDSLAPMLEGNNFFSPVKKQVQAELREFFNHYNHHKNVKWHNMVPILLRNSEIRIANNTDYQEFIKAAQEIRHYKRPTQNEKNLSKLEALNIAKDMVFLSGKG